MQENKSFVGWFCGIMPYLISSNGFGFSYNLSAVETRCRMDGIPREAWGFVADLVTIMINAHRAEVAKQQEKK